jgi:hypothetical protein
MLLQLKMVAVHEISNDTFEMKKKSKIKNEWNLCYLISPFISFPFFHSWSWALTCPAIDYMCIFDDWRLLLMWKVAIVLLLGYTENGGAQLEQTLKISLTGTEFYIYIFFTWFSFKVYSWTNQSPGQQLPSI